MPKKMHIFVSYHVYACVRNLEPRPFSWIGKAGTGVISVDGNINGEWEKFIHENHLEETKEKIAALKEI